MSSGLDRHQKSTTRRTEKTRRPLRLLIILLVLGGLSLSSCRASEDLVTTRDLVSVAEDWFAFFESGQVETYQSLMAADAWWRCDGCKPAIHEGPYFGGRHGADLTDARDSLLLFAASGSITPTCVGEGQDVTCTTRLTDVFRERAGLDAYESRYHFTFDASSITQVVFEPLPPNDRYQTGSEMNAYSLWLQQHHPNQHERLFLVSTMIVEPLERAATHRELIREWLADR